MDFLLAAGPLLEKLRPIALEFSDNGYRLYLVGGAVRDLVFGAGLADADVDLTTDARPDFVKGVLSRHATTLWTQGERFGTIGASVGSLAVEITTHRTENYDSTTRKPTVAFGDSLDVDLSRRDFTINAMAIALPSAEFFDPYGGIGHARQRLLATPIDPIESFSDDPLRMLRAARFLPRFDLTPADELIMAASELAERMRVVSAERISAELDRLLALPDPSSGFQFFRDTNLLRQVVPAFGRFNFDDAAITSSASLASCAGSIAVRRAGLLYLLAIREGLDAARDAMRDLRYSVEVQQTTLRLLRHIQVVIRTRVAPFDVRGVVAAEGLSVSTAAASGEGPLFQGSDTHESEPTEDSMVVELLIDLRQLATNVAAVVDDVDFDGSFFQVLQQLTADGPLGYRRCLSGHEIMSLLDVSPGPVIGQAEALLHSHWIENGEFSRSEAEELLLAWVK